MDRRKFLTRAAVTAASYRRVLGANSRVGMALIGGGRRGREVMKAHLDTGKVDLRVICDVYNVQRDRAQSLLAPTGEKPFECVAHEEALARPGVDAVLIAVPDHLHLDIAKDAFAVGKHVYLEKPATHHFDEGPQLLRAARLSGKVCQVGTQQRSGAHYQQAREQIFAAGKLGKVVFVRAFWSNFPWQARRIEPGPKPSQLDWLRFLGRTPYMEYDAARYDSWRYFPEYGGGVLADILNHWADVAQWMMDDAKPLNAVATGGIYALNDGRANPDSVNAILQYSKGWNLSFESTVLPVRDDRPSVIFVGTEGTLDIARDGYVLTPAKGAPVRVAASGSLELAHASDFLKAIETGKRPNGDVQIALEGVLPCHLARAAYWSGRRMRYDSGTHEIVG